LLITKGVQFNLVESGTVLLNQLAKLRIAVNIAKLPELLSKPLSQRSNAT
jgi:hypothetical protein